MAIKGRFITFEGSEGSGKSTQISLVLDYLKAKNLPVILVREPGGVKISEKIRDILLDNKNKAMADECEVLLYMAARAQLVKEVLTPALNQGQLVLCDRFLDSTIAYQGWGNGVDVTTIKNIGQYAVGNLKPDLKLWFDIDPQLGLSRTNAKKDRIELRPLEYPNRVRQGYLALAKEDPNRIKTIKVDAAKEIIFERVKNFIDKVIK